MPLFNFTTNDYGENWFVSASTRKEAVGAVRRAIHAKWQGQMAYADSEAKKYGQESGRRDRETRQRDDELKFLECCIANASPYDGAEPCSIHEMEDGYVVFSEVA